MKEESTKPRKTNVVFFQLNQILYKIFGNVMLLKNRNMFPNIEFIVSQTKFQLKKEKEIITFYALLLKVKDLIQLKIIVPMWFKDIIKKHKNLKYLIHIE